MRNLNSLLKLKKEKELSFSSLPKSLIDELLNEQLIYIKTISANKKKVICVEAFFEKYKDIENIELANSRSELTKVNTHTKIKKISPQSGLFVNGNCEIEIENSLKQLPFSLNSSIFLKNFPIISKDIILVIVENFENLIYFEKQLKYFQDDNILFIFRNSKALEFLQDTQNKTIYFGDFDLAGIDIFQTQILPRNKNIELFIPQNIEELIKEYGNRELFSKQFSKYKNIFSQNIKIQNLIEFIKHEQKSLEQELFIEL